MKKHFILFLFILLSLSLVRANMASPNIYGYTPSVGLQTKDIDIEQEDLIITLSDTTIAAYYSVRYYILNESENGKLTLIFDAVQPYSEFEVVVDNNPIQLKPNLRDSVFSVTDSLQYSHTNYALFTIDISKGKHIIEVFYWGYPSTFLGDWIAQYTYSYNLEPARAWKTFKNLNLTIDATSLADTLKYQVNVNIQDSAYQLQGKSHTWHFDSIPQDMIDIRFLPKGDLSFMIYPEVIFFIFTILLLVFNLWWCIKWRQSHLAKKYSLPAIVGALLVPALAIVAYIFSYPIIDWLIGKYAARFHGYVFLVIFTYPIFAVIYFVLIWSVDHFYKRKLRNKQQIEN